MKYKLALELVADLFRDEERAISGLPYIVHLVGVSHIVSYVTDDEDVQIAALLHDVLEDIPESKYSEQMMRQDFGDKITDIVKTVSHDESTYGREKARQIYLEQIRSGSIEACIVSAADLLHNSMDIIYEYEKFPEEVKSRFGGDRVQVRVWFWKERLAILKKRLGSDNKIIQDLEPVMASIDMIHSKIM